MEYDRYLIHAPYGGREARCGAWRALVEAQEAGSIRSLGVSNYGVHHLNELEQYIKELEDKNGKGKGGAISVGQWEVHPWLERPDITGWCAERGVVVQASTKCNEEPRFRRLANLEMFYRRTVLWSRDRGSRSQS